MGNANSENWYKQQTYAFMQQNCLSTSVKFHKCGTFNF